MLTANSPSRPNMRLPRGITAPPVFSKFRVYAKNLLDDTAPQAQL